MMACSHGGIIYVLSQSVSSREFQGGSLLPAPPTPTQQVQLAAMPEGEVVQMLQGKISLTAADLIDCFEWPWSSAEVWSASSSMSTHLPLHHSLLLC